MSELDYMHPDIYFGENPLEEIFILGCSRTVFQLGFYKEAKRFYVNAKRDGLCWHCINLINGKTCNYSPGESRNPPIPGQRCHNCDQILAEWV